MPIAYVKIFLRAGVTPMRRPFMIRVIGRSNAFIRGYEVNDEGDEISRGKATRILHVIHVDAIRKIKTLSMSRKYGGLMEGP